jgi:hypothetical protein
VNAKPNEVGLSSTGATPTASGRAADHAVVVVTNLSESPISIALAPQPNTGSIDGSYVELLSEQAGPLVAGSTLSLEPWGFRVFVRGPRSSAP